MKILHVVEPLAGGIITFLKSLVENMPLDNHLIIHGERKFVLPLSEAKKQLNYSNVKFVKWKSAQRSVHFRKDFKAFAELYSMIKRLHKSNAFDIVHLHSSKGGFLGRVVCRLLGLQQVVLYTPNGAPFMAGTSAVSNFFYKQLERVGSLFGGKVICCSPSEKQAYEVAGIDAVAINNGTKKIKLPDIASRRKNNSTFRIVTAGRVVSQKNPAMFNTVALYFEEFAQFEFIWIGDGPDRHLLTAKNIAVTGWLEKDEVDRLITTSDLYLSTATFEGLSFSALEALALKKPVLLSDCTGNKDLIRKGLNGSIFKNAEEAIISVLQFSNNKSMLTIMGEYSGKHCTESFDQADTSMSYKKLYRNTAFSNVKRIPQQITEPYGAILNFK